MDLAGKKVLVIGLARTGRDCGRFLVKQGARVLMTDLRPENELKQEIEALKDLPLEYRLGAEDAAWVEGLDLVIPSPGVPQENALLQEARSRGIPIMSEVELAFQFLRAPLIAITGTNGKSTTTTLTGEIFKAAGKKVFTGGNLGTPLIDSVSQSWDWAVAEISSFQLEWVNAFRPKIAVLLNLTEDHLDRYPDFAAYCSAKENIFRAQKSDDFAVLNRDDALVWQIKDRIAARVISFGLSEIDEGVFATATDVVWRSGGSEQRFPLKNVKIQGVHNVENIMAAVAVAATAGIDRDTIQNVLETFSGLEHRLEWVREKDGVRYYNDSKGTNVGAVVKSLASFSGPVILIAGGVDKGGSYAVLNEEVKRTVRRLVLFGAAKDIIARALGALTDTVIVENLEAAVRDAAAHAQPGDVVLLSPACSSFDMFRNYAERGTVFKNLVQAL
ncbi:MAG TPA: UDP-N-acetylmuramoyl-L-alanine--D-glutamate ligase [Candidatus Binatia bacterium]|jgi:UDP-N-acetylmuramoylalanine--D-glutamate ligase